MSSFREIGGTESLGHDKAYPSRFDEIDLVDIIGFFWRTRLVVGSGIVAGALLGTVVWYLKRPASILEKAQRPLIVAQLVMDKVPGVVLSTLPKQINNFLKTPAGSRAFYEGLTTQSERSEFPINEWIIQQQNGDGLLKSLDVSGSNMSMTFLNLGKWSDSQIQERLPAAFNKSIGVLNVSLSEVNAMLLQVQEDQLETMSKMARVKFEALQFFDRSAKVSGDMHQTLVGEMIIPLVKSNDQEMIIFLLNAIPGDEAKKSELLLEFRNQLMRYERLEKQRKSIIKALEYEVVTMMPQVISISDIQTLPTSSPAFMLLQSLPVLLVSGLLLGGLFGTALAIGKVFWTHNSSRLRAIFEK